MTRMKFYGTAIFGVGLSAFALWMVTTLSLGAFFTGTLVALAVVALVVTSYAMSNHVAHATVTAEESR